ncbi:MAG: DinB family protein [Phycisphaerales bacterium]|nr:DinB family protein [Phycisphaerales bacterium]
MSPKRPPARRAASRTPSARKAAARPAKQAGPRARAAAKPAPKAQPKRPPKARPSTLMRARAVASLRFARSIIEGLIKGFPEDKLTYQPAMTDNHVIWTLGHLAITNQWFAGLLDGQPVALPGGYDELFGYKSKPNPDLAVYPPLAEVQRHYEATFARLIRAAESLRDEDFGRACATESGGFAKDKGEVLERAVWHEGWHGGQLSSLRRSLGLPPVMG